MNVNDKYVSLVSQMGYLDWFCIKCMPSYFNF